MSAEYFGAKMGVWLGGRPAGFFHYCSPGGGLKEIKKIINEHQIKGIIIGNPINMDGSASQSSQSAKDLAINLSKDVTKNITLWDERLSSQGAFNLSSDLAINTTKKVKKLDENSAQFILQGALDYLTKENT